MSPYFLVSVLAVYSGGGSHSDIEVWSYFVGSRVISIQIMVFIFYDGLLHIRIFFDLFMNFSRFLRFTISLAYCDFPGHYIYFGLINFFIFMNFLKLLGYYITCILSNILNEYFGLIHFIIFDYGNRIFEPRFYMVS